MSIPVRYTLHAGSELLKMRLSISWKHHKRRGRVCCVTVNLQGSPQEESRPSITPNVRKASLATLQHLKVAFQLDGVVALQKLQRHVVQQVVFSQAASLGSCLLRCGISEVFASDVVRSVTTSSQAQSA